MDIVDTPIRCDTLADLPAFVGHAHAVVIGGERFGWWTQDDGAEPVLAFVLDRDGAAYRLCNPEGEIVGLFANFVDCIRIGATLYERAPSPRSQKARRRVAQSAQSQAH